MKLLILLILAFFVFFLIMFFLEYRYKLKSHFCLEFSINNIKIKGDIKMVNLTATQYVNGSLSVVDRLGNPSEVEAGSVVISSEHPDLFSVERVDSDEKAFKIIAHSPGVGQIYFSADADLGDGVETINGFAGVEVVPAHAAGFGISFAEPQEQ